MLELSQSRHDWVHLLVLNLLGEGREVKEKIPAPCNDPGRQEVTNQEWPHPIPGVLLRRTKGRVAKAIFPSMNDKDAKASHGKRPKGSIESSNIGPEVKIRRSIRHRRLRRTSIQL